MAEALKTQVERLRRELLVEGPLEIREEPAPPEAQHWELDDGRLAATVVKVGG
jgi:hypothetical protein